LARGFLSGVIWGVVLSAMVLWVASQLGGMISLLLAPPEQVSDQAPPPPQTAAAPEPAPAAPEPGALPATEPSRLGRELPAGTSETPPQAETAPARAPQAGAEAAPPAEPAQAPEPAAPGRIGEEPARPDTAVASLPAPGADAAPREIEDAPAPRAAPGGVTAPGAPARPGSGAAGRPVPDAPPPPPGQPAPATPAAPDADSAPAAVTPPVPRFTEPQIVDVPAPREDEPPMPGEAGQPPGQPEVAALPPPEQEQPPATAGAPPPGPRVLRPGEGGLRSNRLPTIGGEPPARAEEEEPAVDQAADENAPAIERFAVPFENPEGRPLMAVILLPDPAAQAPQIGALPFPVSYAVDAGRADATERMRAIRAAGYEVVLLAPLPEGASPRDAEVAFESYLAAVPEAVAVLDSRAAVFQSGRLLASQVADILADTGHGMITYARGLNSAIQVAEREGIPAALVFRDIDGSGQDAAAIRRFLDQAAFRAGQLQRVVLVARNRPETIRALVEWSLGNRARTVTLAPVSAVLLGR